MSASSSAEAARAPIGTDRREEARGDFVSADHADAFTLDNRGDAGKQAIVAAAKQLRQPGRALYRAPIEPEIGELGPRHRADDHHLGDGAPFQRGE